MVTPMSCFILISLLYNFVDCEIQNLNVRKVDKSLIAKKRRDTLDMCRIFTEENAKLMHTEPNKLPSFNHVLKLRNKRYKREVDFDVNPALNAEDAKRVENIVDKLYDEMEERGEKVTYRQYNLVNTTTTKKIDTKATTSAMNMSTNSPNRRFFFAPASLVSAPPPDVTSVPPETDYEGARWKHGIIPYFIDPKTYDAQLQEMIINAFDYIEKVTCIRMQKLRERPTDRKSLHQVDWVYITNPSGVKQCVHSNEKRKVDGVQMSVLGYDCMSLGDIVHEVMHILGFPHEHTRSDRDQYISILWDNIKPGYRKYFEIAKPGDQYTLENLPYDYQSILHYPCRAFSKNGQYTIMAKAGKSIGQRAGLSEIDVEKVGAIYGNECVDRNRQYLLETCPSVVKPRQTATPNVTNQDIEDYFKDRLWPFGIINYKLRDNVEFSIEERENIKAVIRHIEKETCIIFRDIAEDEENDLDPDNTSDKLEIPDKDNNKAFPDDIYEFKPESDSHNDKSNKVPANIIVDSVKENNLEASMKNVAENEIQKIDEQPAVLKSFRNKNKVAKKIKRKPSRRHAASIMIFARSAAPGCKCPKPGRPKGKMVLEINNDCFNSVNDLLHLFVHVLGLDHQHNMHDRDSYLHINWNQLIPDLRNELKEKLPAAAAAGFPYDYQSVMHYPWLQIKGGVINMIYPIWNDGWAMGHWQGLSSLDVQKLNLLYFVQCTERKRQQGVTKSESDDNDK